jgi:hypothetical protein
MPVLGAVWVVFDLENFQGPLRAFRTLFSAIERAEVCGIASLMHPTIEAAGTFYWHCKEPTPIWLRLLWGHLCAKFGHFWSFSVHFGFKMCSCSLIMGK